MRHGHDVKRQIDEMHQPRPNAERKHEGEDVLHIDTQQRQEREEEMAENNDQADIEPSPFFADDIPESFLRHIPVPNDEVLREMDVGIKDREGEHQGAEKIVLMFVQHVGEHTLAVEDHGDDIRRGQGNPDAAGKIINAIHRRVPLVLEGFHPHDHCESNSKGKQQYADRSKLPHLPGALNNSRSVLVEADQPRKKTRPCRT